MCLSGPTEDAEANEVVDAGAIRVVREAIVP